MSSDLHVDVCLLLVNKQPAAVAGPPKVPLSPEPAATGTRPVIPSSQSSFAEFKKQALEKEERVCILHGLVYSSSLELFA